MHETPEELARLQQILDESAAHAGPHLSSVITDERRLTAVELCRRLQGMRLLVVATVTADGRPLAAPVDGYLLHGAFHFSSARDSIRMRHLQFRPAVSAAHVPGDHLAVSIHGQAEIYELTDPQRPELRQAMLDHYVPTQGAEFETLLEGMDALAARLDADRIFTFHMGSEDGHMDSEDGHTESEDGHTDSEDCHTESEDGPEPGG